jgi:hypothetical protein
MQFLPAQLSAVEVEKKVLAILEPLKPLDQKMSGKYIGMCLKELKDFASGDLVKEAVEKTISS